MKAALLKGIFEILTFVNTRTLTDFITTWHRTSAIRVKISFTLINFDAHFHENLIFPLPLCQVWNVMITFCTPYMQLYYSKVTMWCHESKQEKNTWCYIILFSNLMRGKNDSILVAYSALNFTWLKCPAIVNNV